MKPDHHARGGAPVAVLSHMESWEANLILNLRLWCEGSQGQAQVWNEYRKSLPAQHAERACRSFEVLLRTLLTSSYRPLVRHDVACGCVGADEGIFANLVRTASEGHLNDAALIATLLVGPAQAEHIAMLAGEVGECMQQIHRQPYEATHVSTGTVVRLH